MSTPFLLRKMMTDTESPLLIASGGSYYFKSITISNSLNSTAHFYLAVTAGRAFAEIGDFIVYHYDITGYNILTLNDILIPDGHELRGWAGTGGVLSVVGSGVFE